MGTATPRGLLVVRDLAHARAASAALAGVVRAGGASFTVWTARDFFERLSAWALLRGDAVCVRDDRASLWAVAAALARGGPMLPRIAHDADELRRACVHGGATATDVAKALDTHDDEGGGASAGRPSELFDLFSRLASSERALEEAGRIDGALALSRAVARIEEGDVPAVLRGFDEVRVLDLVDPSDLELRSYIALARAGVRVVARVPVDSSGRGLLAGVDHVLARLEAAHDATALELDLVDVADADARGDKDDGGGDDDVGAFARAWYGGGVVSGAAGVEVLSCADEASEAREIASVIAAWRRARPGAPVAVALRALDASAARIADALVAQRVPVRVKKRALASSPAAKLILDVVALARDGAPRDRLVAVLASPALVNDLSPAEAAKVLRVLRLAAARSDVEGSGRPRGGYRHRLERYRSGLETAAEQGDVDNALAHVERALAQAARIPRHATLLAHLNALRSVAEDILDDDAGVGAAEVKDFLDDARRACAAVAGNDDGARVALEAVAAILERELEREQGPAPAVAADDAVEIMALPDLWGRRIDHVVVAGCVEGRVPLVTRKERLLADADRIYVNNAVGRRVLRLVDDDPLEPSPVPRAQALEPVWFLGALLAASTSLLLTAPRRDGRGRELSPSVFLLEAQRALGDARDVREAPIESARTRRFAREASPREVTVRASWLRARGALGDDEGAALGIDVALLAHADRMKRVAVERARFFHHKARGAPLPEARAPYAFAVDAARIAASFGTSFGLTPERPLTPTRLEALAECRVHGFLQHVLKVDVDPPAGNSADARVLGTLAHAVMERFFKERKAAGVPAARVTDADRDRVRALLAEEAEPVIAFRATGHLAAIRAQIAWLETALVRAVSMLARDPVVRGVEPHDFEVRIGGTEPQHPSVPIDVGGRRLWIGGVIDRIDEGRTARAVIDYKNSGTTAVRRKAHADALFEKHFQLLLYLRLLEAHRPTSTDTALHGYLVSLRDGTTSSDVTEVEDLRARVLDDARDDGLAAGVGRVVLPILEGTLPPDAGDRCDSCRLQRICRIPLTPELAPELDDADEGSGV